MRKWWCGFNSLPSHSISRVGVRGFGRWAGGQSSPYHPFDAPFRSHSSRGCRSAPGPVHLAALDCASGSLRCVWRRSTRPLSGLRPSAQAVAPVSVRSGGSGRRPRSCASRLKNKKPTPGCAAAQIFFCKSGKYFFLRVGFLVLRLVGFGFCYSVSLR